MGVEIGLQDEGSCQLVEVTSALFARNAHLDAGSARILGAKGFVPHLDGYISLALQGFGKACRAATCQVGLAAFVKRLTDDDQPGTLLGCDVCNLGCVYRARNVFDDGQWVGDGAGQIADSQANTFFAVVDCKNSHDLFFINLFWMLINADKR
jgi:hypothetical protein